MYPTSLYAEAISENRKVLGGALSSHLHVTGIDSVQLQEVAPEVLVEEPLNAWSGAAKYPLVTVEFEEGVELRQHFRDQHRLSSAHFKKSVGVETHARLVLFHCHF